MGDTTKNLGVYYDGSSNIGFAAHLNAKDMALLTNASGSSVTTGDVVVLTTSAASSFTTTTTAGDARPVFVVPHNITGSDTSSTKTIADGEAGWVYRPGAYVPAAAVDGAVGVGEYLKTSSTAKKLTGTGVTAAAGVQPPSTACAIALQAASGAGQIPVMLLAKAPMGGTIRTGSSTVTLSSGAATVTAGILTVLDTEGGASSDDLDTITVSGVAVGDIVYLTCASDARYIKTTTSGNIAQAGLYLSDPKQIMTLRWDGSAWQVIGQHYRPTVTVLRYDGTNQSVNSGTATQATGASTLIDTIGAAGTNQITVPHTGLYRTYFSMVFATGAYSFAASVYKNGSHMGRHAVSDNTSTSAYFDSTYGDSGVSASFLLPLDKGDVLTLRVWQNSGSAKYLRRWELGLERVG